MAKQKTKSRTQTKVTGPRGFLASVNAAFEKATRQAIKEALAAISNNTSIGKLLDQIADSPYLDNFRSLTVQEFIDALTGAGSRGGPRATRRTSSEKKVSVAGKPGRRKSYNTRTEQGRKKIDLAVAGFLQETGEASAEGIRKATAGTPAQLRQSLDRLVKQKKVEKTGQRRGTRYRWIG